MSGLDDKKLRIIPFRKGQLDEAAKVYRQVWRETVAYAEDFTEDQARREIEGMRNLWVTLDNGEISGLVGGMPLSEYVGRMRLAEDSTNGHVKEALDKLVSVTSDKCYYIDTLAIIKFFLNMKRGTRLLKFIIDDRLRNGFTCFLLRTTLHPENPAMKLYNTFKFEPFLDSDGVPVVQIVRQRRFDGRPEEDHRAYRLKT